MQNRGPTLLALTIAFLVVTWVTVGLRCIVRVRIVKALGLDDYLIALAQVSHNHFTRDKLYNVTILISHRLSLLLSVFV